jgi:hypothetical protein
MRPVFGSFGYVSHRSNYSPLESLYVVVKRLSFPLARPNFRISEIFRNSRRTGLPTKMS